MTKDPILIIEDDPDIVELLQYNLEKEGYPVRTAKDGESGLHAARRYKPGLILLDLMMPGMDGLEVCRHLKRDPGTSGIPLMMITAKGEESDVVAGLELGADDYISKPFSPREVLARIRAVQRRGGARVTQSKTRIELGPVVLDRERLVLHVDGQEVELTRAEFRMLWAMAVTPGRVFTRDELVEHITAGETFISDRNVDVHVSAVRKKLGASTDLIQTVRGVGYKCRD
jgi:two-component system phosphate regulon response regulator PhoB